jgi:hypothetical protein
VKTGQVIRSEFIGSDLDVQIATDDWFSVQTMSKLQNFVASFAFQAATKHGERRLAG